MGHLAQSHLFPRTIRLGPEISTGYPSLALPEHLLTTAGGLLSQIFGVTEGMNAVSGQRTHPRSVP
jgi:hypothetical protein